MPGFIVRLLITAAGLWLASAVIGGVQIVGLGTLVTAALLLGLVNAVVRPVLVFLTFPITILTLGLFLWAINAGMLLLVASFLSDFTIVGFGSALLGSAVVSVTSWVASWNVGSNGRIEVLSVERQG